MMEAAHPGDIRRFEPVIEAIRQKGDLLRQIVGVFGIRPGFRTLNGEMTEEPAIIVVTWPGQVVGAIPAEVEGILVEVRTATALELTRGLLPLSAWEGIAPEAAPQIGYTPPDPGEASLEEMLVQHITCHVGPDSGWTTLKPFLEETRTSLTVAMYEFYADHILETVTRLGENSDASLKMILQVSSKDAATEQALRQSWGQRLDFTRASVSGPNRVFNNSYHTKVAVRDSSAFWLSSGNWSPHSQPLVESDDDSFLYRRGNREWHVIVEDAPLAQMVEKFIEHDMRQARAAGAPEAAPVMPDLLIPESWLEPEAAAIQERLFSAQTIAAAGEPVRVRPLMSPDNYAAEILKLIQGAERQIYLQFSYIRQPSTEKFDEIISAIAQKMQAGLDVRVLVGSSQDSEDSELLVGVRGWQRSMFRKQTSSVHNKGILIDGKIAVVGSNNWSSDGTQYNRDASLVFYSEAITNYYTEVFLFDWNYLSRPVSSAPELSPVLAPDDGSTPPGMVRIPWQAWYED